MNYVANWGSLALTTVGLNNDEWSDAHARELDATHEVVAATGDYLVNQGGTGKLYDAARETTSHIYEGDVQSIGDFTEFGAGFITGGGAAQSIPNAARQALQTAKTLSNATLQRVKNLAHKAKTIFEGGNGKPDIPLEQRLALLAENDFRGDKIPEPIGRLRGALAGGDDRLPSVTYSGDRETLFHYTNESGMEGILDSRELFASRGYQNARYGDGQYLSDLSPDDVVVNSVRDLTREQKLLGKRSAEHLSTLIFGRANKTALATHYVEIDISGLMVRQGLTRSGDEIRVGVQVVLGERSLDLRDRIVRHGKVIE